jgi:hypothetical protein
MVMTRVLTLGLVTVATLALSALVPSAASAHAFHGWGWHGGFGHHGFYGFGPTMIVQDDSCLVRQVIDTRRGPRLRLVNVCGY